MRIVIDIGGILETSGLGNYVRMLVEHLAAVDEENEYLLYLSQWREPDRAALERAIPKRPNFRLVRRRIPNVVSLFAEYRLGVGLTELLLGGGPGTVFHGPSNMLPRLKRIKSVISFHHYMPAGHPLFPPNPGARARFYFQTAEMAARAASRVAVVSEFTRKDVVEKLGVPAEKVSVVAPGGPNPAYRRIDGCVLPPALAARLPGKYAVFPGPLNERKNLPAFLKAFASVKEKLGDLRLAITSVPPPAFAREIESLTAALGLTERVVLLGEVSEEEMAALYNRAECLVYPSLFEGFGSPPLEAMACGCPVAASNAAAIPETTAGAALLFDPADEAAMAAALLKIIGDGALRKELTAKGFERVKAFSWRKMAEEFLAIYEDVARSGA